MRIDEFTRMIINENEKNASLGTLASRGIGRISKLFIKSPRFRTSFFKNVPGKGIAKSIWSGINPRYLGRQARKAGLTARQFGRNPFGTLKRQVGMMTPLDIGFNGLMLGGTIKSSLKPGSNRAKRVGSGAGEMLGYALTPYKRFGMVSNIVGAGIGSKLGNIAGSIF